MIGLSSSTYYRRPKVPRGERERADTELRDQIERVQCEHGSGTGYRFVQHYLRRSGVVAGERKIRRIMKKYGLHAKLKRAFVRDFTVRSHPISFGGSHFGASATGSYPRPGFLATDLSPAGLVGGMSLSR